LNRPRVRPNGISTCIKGKFAWDFINSEDRLVTPLIRVETSNDGPRFREATWDEALTLMAETFTKIKKRHGADALAFIASSKCTNEESYLMQKLARAVIGTNNIDNCSRYCQTPATMGLKRTVGYGGDSGSISDIERADLVIIVGSNTAESHPVLATRVKRSHKHRGQRLIVADLRKHEMARRADLFIRPEPSTDAVWINAVAKYILEQGWHNREFITQWVKGFEDYKIALQQYTLEFAERVTKLPSETIQKIATEIHQAGSVCILWAMGVTQHCGGSDTSTSISNLLLLTGNYMRAGTGAYPLRGHNNVQGTSDFGSMPNTFPGYQPVEDEEIRKKFEAGWGIKLPPKNGLDNHEMIRAIHEGKLKSMYIKGEDTITSDANANDVKAAFSMLDFFVVQDVNFSETARFANVVLPASPSLEKEGPSPARNDASSVSIVPLSRWANRTLTGKSSRTSPIVSAPGGTIVILRKSWMSARRWFRSLPESATIASRATKACSGRWRRTARIRLCSSRRNFHSPTVRRSSTPSNGLNRAKKNRWSLTII
jgi:formate dehydrogenase major subunit